DSTLERESRAELNLARVEVAQRLAESRQRLPWIRSPSGVDGPHVVGVVDVEGVDGQLNVLATKRDGPCQPKIDRVIAGHTELVTAKPGHAIVECAVTVQVGGDPGARIIGEPRAAPN